MKRSIKTRVYSGLFTALVVALVAGSASVPTARAQSEPGQASPAISQSVVDVIRLAESGVSEDVLVAFVQNAESPYNLSADNILYLKDLGFPPPVLVAMLNRDSVLRSQAAPPPGAPAAPVPPVPVAPAPEPQAPPPTAAPAPVYVSNPPQNVAYFYNDLAPYGTWIELPGLGWCWQPQVVVFDHTWRPYCHRGHWVWTDAGWYWQSDYTWGWAPFHYGRWQLHERCGWVWLPDTVWAPAWVTWREAGDHCGWAPLPPHADFDLHLGFRFNGVHVGVDFDFGLRPEHFTFVALRDIHENDCGRHFLPPVEVTRIYNRTTVINNYVVNNTTIINRGVRVERVTEVTHRPVERVIIRDVPGPVHLAKGAAPSHEVTVYRPKFEAPPKPVRMVAQKVDERHPVVHTAAITPAPREHKAAMIGNTPAPAMSAPRPPAEQARPEPSSRPEIKRAEKPQPRMVLERGAPRTTIEKQPAPPIVEKAPPRQTVEKSAGRTPAEMSHQVQKTAPPPVNEKNNSRAAAPVTSGPKRLIPTPRAGEIVSEQAKAAAQPKQQFPIFQPPSTQPVLPRYPLQTYNQGKTTPVQTGPPGENAHEYTPKSAQQAAEIRPAPPANSRTDRTDRDGKKQPK